MADYNEENCKKVIASYNGAIDNLLASKDPEQVIPELVKVEALCYGDKNTDYIKERVEIAPLTGKLKEAVNLYKLDRLSGLGVLTELFQNLQKQVVTPYIKCHVKQEKIKPKWTEQENLAKAVTEAYQELVMPKENQN